MNSEVQNRWIKIADKKMFAWNHGYILQYHLLINYVVGMQVFIVGLQSCAGIWKVCLYNESRIIFLWQKKYYHASKVSTQSLCRSIVVSAPVSNKATKTNLYGKYRAILCISCANFWRPERCLFSSQPTFKDIKKIIRALLSHFSQG